ncbi:MAG: hypothetical protein ACRETX_13315 [Steroidobacteraceae bacterium]
MSIWSLEERRRAAWADYEAAVQRLRALPRGTHMFTVALRAVDAADREVVRLAELHRGVLEDAEIQLALTVVADTLRGRIRDPLLRQVLAEVEVALGARAIKVAREWRARVRRGRRAA